MNEVTKELLKAVSDWEGKFEGAFNIREDGACAGRQSSDNIKIESKTDNPGLNIRIAPHAKGDRVYIPACVTHGCGVHTETGESARHNGIHRFFLEKGSHVLYQEKHLGTGKGAGLRSIDPVTEAHIGEDAVLEMDTAQIGGVDKTLRKTAATVEKGGKLLIRERILTEHSQQARTEFKVELNGEGSGADIISRSVARDESHQEYCSTIVGNAPCTGHSECDAIIAGSATVDAAPQLWAHNTDAALIHEAAIGKIAGEQILKLRTLGLTEQEAEAKIIEGFLN